MKKTIDLLKLPFTIFLLFLEVKNSKINGNYKIKAFLTLVNLYLKIILFSNNNRIKKIKIFGFIVNSYYYTTLLLLFREIFLQQEYYFHSETQTPIIIDCGANIGMSIIYFKWLFPDCSIIAFEPNPTTFDMLKKNVAENNLSNIELINKALSMHSANIKFYTNEDNENVAASTFKNRGGSEELTVKSIKLSDFIKTEIIDFIKMDIEGAEHEVISEIVNTNKISQVKEYKIEYHHLIKENSSNLSLFLRYFEDAGYNYNITAHYSKKSMFQDILIHAYKN